MSFRDPSMIPLHPKLAADTIDVGRLPLSRLLLMNDAAYPWFVLVPQRESVRELLELAEADQDLLMREMVAVSSAIRRGFRADKINMAALGNLVPQLHVHVIGRFTTDPAWPAPVWGRPASPYPPEAAQTRIETFRAAFEDGEPRLRLTHD
jgi:diadenosine tetraphosphate (Ap4A) HIT family hydrolase